MPLDIISAMEKLGYLSDKEGVCNGIGLMAIQASLRGEIDTFVKRMNFIHSYSDSETFKHDVELALSIRGNQNNTTQSQSDETQSKNELSQENVKMLCSIHPFLDGVELYAQPDLHPELFEKGMAPKGHNTELVAQYIAENSEEMKSTEQILVAHTGKELTKFLERLEGTLGKEIEGMAMKLTIPAHVMTLIRSQEKWILVNHDKIQIFSSAKDCTNHIISGFSLGENPSKHSIFSIDFHPSIKTENVRKMLIKLKDVEEKSLLDKINYQDSSGFQPFWLALHFNRLDIVEELLEKTSDKKYLEIPDALFYAIFKNYSEMVSLLINKGANVNAVLKDSTPLLEAVKQGNVSLAELLLKNQANPNLPKKGWTPLLEAVKQDNVEMIRLLHKYNANVDQIYQHNEEIDTPLKHAVDNNKINLVNLLLSLKANPLLKISKGWSLLHDVMCLDKSNDESNEIQEEIIYNLLQKIQENDWEFNLRKIGKEISQYHFEDEDVSSKNLDYEKWIENLTNRLRRVEEKHLEEESGINDLLNQMDFDHTDSEQLTNEKTVILDPLDDIDTPKYLETINQQENELVETHKKEILSEENDNIELEDDFIDEVINIWKQDKS